MRADICGFRSVIVVAARGEVGEFVVVFG